MKGISTAKARTPIVRSARICWCGAPGMKFRRIALRRVLARNADWSLPASGRTRREGGGPILGLSLQPETAAISICKGQFLLSCEGEYETNTLLSNFVAHSREFRASAAWHGREWLLPAWIQWRHMDGSDPVSERADQ